MTTLITGGNSRIGVALANLLTSSGRCVLFASRPVKVPTGSRSVHFDCLSFGTQLDLHGDSPFIDLAISRGFKRFVLLTAASVPIELAQYGVGQALIHKHLEDKWVDYFVLRPDWFMENFTTAHISTIQATSEFFSSIPTGKIPFVAVADIAQVAYEAIVNGKKDVKEKIIIGPGVLSLELRRVCTATDPHFPSIRQHSENGISRPFTTSFATTTMSSSTRPRPGPPERLPEELIQDSFHSYLKSSLTQAKAERLLDEELLSSAEADLMITGPALCLFFAALRSTTSPPSVPLPKSKGSHKQPTDLSYENCPPPFIPFLKVWAKNVPIIQGMAPEYQHDLARIICGLEPLAQPVNTMMNGVAADLRGVAIEISQRRSFQDRYAVALQAALDAGGAFGNGKSPKRATFIPPPVYGEAPPEPPRLSLDSSRTSIDSSRQSSDSSRPSIDSSRHSLGSRRTVHSPLPPLPLRPAPTSPASSQTLSPTRPLQINSSSSRHSRNLSASSIASSTSSLPRSPLSPSILAFDSPAIEFIRETLYASLADQLERTPGLRKLLHTDPARAYFGSVAFAILDVSTRAITPEGEVEGVLGKRLSLAECPEPLKPFMKELVGIGKQAKEIDDEDNEVAIKMAMAGRAIPALTKMERVKRMLEGGIGVERDGREGDGGQRSSIEGKGVTFVNRINGLALGLTKLKAFRDRQEQVFKVLAGIGTG